MFYSDSIRFQVSVDHYLCGKATLFTLQRCQKVF